MSHILLGVTGSIAAYKAADIALTLVKNHCQVDVVMTRNALNFITPLTLRTTTQRPVYTDMFASGFSPEVEHISLAKRTDLCLIAPASANFIGKLSSGIADDMLTTVVMAIQGIPVYICPAMNTAMYENAVVQENISKLQQRGYRFIEPRESRLACGDLGKGALAEVAVICETVLAQLKTP